MKYTIPDKKHLTSLDRRAVDAMLAAGGSEAKTPRIKYRLSPADSDGIRILTISKSGRDDFGRTIDRIYHVPLTFERSES